MNETIPQTDFATLGKRPLQHSTFFELTFEMLMLAQAFLRCILPEKLLARLDIDALTIEPKQMFDVMFKETRADVVYRVPIRDSATLLIFSLSWNTKVLMTFGRYFKCFAMLPGFVNGSLRQQRTTEALINPTDYRR
jgi:hypothetical protein